jgi:hypothetical protein
MVSQVTDKPTTFYKWMMHATAQPPLCPPPTGLHLSASPPPQSCVCRGGGQGVSKECRHSNVSLHLCVHHNMM